MKNYETPNDLVTLFDREGQMISDGAYDLFQVEPAEVYTSSLGLEKTAEEIDSLETTEDFLE